MGVNIGQAAKASGLSERMIRYHEKQGLIPAPKRSGGGYRSYSDDDVRRMRTIALAQEVGFPTEVIRQLVSMIDKAKDERAAEAKAEALAEIDRKERALVALRGSIANWVEGHEPDPEEIEEPDIDWGPPSEPLAGIPIGPKMVVLRPAATHLRAREPVLERPEARGLDHRPERLRDRMRDLLGTD